MTNQDAKNALIALLGLYPGASDCAIAVNVIGRTMQGTDADLMEAEARRLLCAGGTPTCYDGLVTPHAAGSLSGITAAEEAKLQHLFGHSPESLAKHGNRTSASDLVQQVIDANDFQLSPAVMAQHHLGVSREAREKYGHL